MQDTLAFGMFEVFDRTGGAILEAAIFPFSYYRRNPYG